MLGSRFGYYAWCALACPLIGWIAAVFGTHGEGGLAKFVFLFVFVPALLALAGAYRGGRRRVDAACGAVVAGLCGAASFLLTIVWMASMGVFDT